MSNKNLVSAEHPLSERQLNQVEEICAREGIPITGITILGGKPYINVTGLDRKVQDLCKKRDLEYAGMKIEILQQATEDMKAKVKATLTVFDKKGFESSLRKAKNGITAELVRELKAVFLYSFEDIGSASPASLKMSTMKNADVVDMMASRRATNRAKREFTGCGLTSIDEMGIEPPMNKAEQPIETEERNTEPISKNQLISLENVRRAKGIPEEEFKNWLIQIYRIEHRNEIPKYLWKPIIEALKNWEKIGRGEYPKEKEVKQEKPSTPEPTPESTPELTFGERRMWENLLKSKYLTEQELKLLLALDPDNEKDVAKILSQIHAYFDKGGVREQRIKEAEKSEAKPEEELKTPNQIDPEKEAGILREILDKYQKACEEKGVDPDEYAKDETGFPPENLTKSQIINLTKAVNSL